MISVILFMTTTPFYGPNIIVISENKWVNKNGWVKGRGVIFGEKKYYLKFNVLGHLKQFFTLQNELFYSKL